MVFYHLKATEQLQGESLFRKTWFMKQVFLLYFMFAIPIETLINKTQNTLY